MNASTMAVIGTVGSGLAIFVILWSVAFVTGQLGPRKGGRQ